jgi:hypothetical protein
MFRLQRPTRNSVSEKKKSLPLISAPLAVTYCAKISLSQNIRPWLSFISHFIFDHTVFSSSLTPITSPYFSSSFFFRLVFPSTSVHTFPSSSYGIIYHLHIQLFFTYTINRVNLQELTPNTAYSTTHTTREVELKKPRVWHEEGGLSVLRSIDSCSQDHPPSSRLTFHSANTCEGRASGHVPTLHSIIASQHASIIRNNINAYRKFLVIWHASKGSGLGVLGQAQSMINFHLAAPKLSIWQLNIAVRTDVITLSANLN